MSDHYGVRVNPGESYERIDTYETLETARHMFDNVYGKLTELVAYYEDAGWVVIDRHVF